MISQVGKRVLLIDMDLRRPRLHRSLGLDRSPGMTDVLAGQASFAEVAKPSGVPNLWFIPAGKSCDNATELLHSLDIVAFFADVRNEYDYILIDSSPVLRAADVSILANPELCSVIYVTHVNHTPKPLLKYSLNMLRDAHVLGVIMNDIEMNKISSIYYSYQYPNYAYYAYAYAYGYEYDYHDGHKKKPHSRRPWRSYMSKAGDKLRRTFLPLE